MKTFEEALQELTLVTDPATGKPAANPNKDQIAQWEGSGVLFAQAEFVSDIESSELANALANAQIRTLANVSPDLHTMLYSLFMNGMMIGVAVGVRMERNEL